MPFDQAEFLYAIARQVASIVEEIGATCSISRLPFEQGGARVVATLKRNPEFTFDIHQGGEVLCRATYLQVKMPIRSSEWSVSGSNTKLPTVTMLPVHQHEKHGKFHLAAPDWLKNIEEFVQAVKKAADNGGTPSE